MRKQTVPLLLIALALVMLVTLASLVGLGWWYFRRDRTIPVDLIRICNGKVTESTSFVGGNDNPNTLEEFPVGTNTFAGVRFAVNGVIQLNGRYPDIASGIRIERKCRQLHLLHGAAGKQPDGTTIARIVAHYANGVTEEFPLLYGRHVRDWWYRPGNKLPDPESIVAWRGQNKLTRKEGAQLMVYRSSFKNPRPSTRITAVDFVSLNTGCWPFFLGFTLE